MGARDAGLNFPLNGPASAGGPTPRFVGDLWYCTTTANGFTANTLYEHNGAAWTAVTRGRLVNVQYLVSASGTYTPTTGATSAMVEVIGDGGGGGGSASAAGQSGAGGGGGGGGYARKYYATLAASYAYTVGQGGAGGGAGNNGGTSGGGSVFDATGVNVQGGGGGGGAGSAASASAQISANVAGGTATNGDLNISGGQGISGVTYSATLARSGDGAASGLGYGSNTTGIRVASNGGSGHAYGGGGSGGNVTNGSAAASGGMGAPGIIIVTEYA